VNDMMMTDVPGWLTALAWAGVTLGVVSALLIARDVLANHRGWSWTEKVVWISSGLYLGPLAVWLERRWAARRGTPTVARTGLAGGAASALAHLVGVPLVVLSGLTIAGIDLWPMILVIAVLATTLLAIFEATAGKRLLTAAWVAALTVLAFDLGMAGWMLLLHFTENMPTASHIAFWFLMQLGVVLGLLTALPALRWLDQRPARTSTAV